MLRENTSYVVVFCSWEMLSTWENMISLPRMLREHAERTHPMSSFAVDLERTCSQFERRCQSWENMISLPRLREHAERTHPMSTANCWVISLWRNFLWILGLSLNTRESLSLPPSLPLLSLSSSICPLPCRRGRWGEQCGYIFIYIHIHIIYRRGRRGEQRGDLCVDSRQRSQGPLLRRSRPSSHCFQNPGKHSPK